MEWLGRAMQRIELKGSAHVSASAEWRDDLGGRQGISGDWPPRPSDSLVCRAEVGDIFDWETLVHYFSHEGSDVVDDCGCAGGRIEWLRGLLTKRAEQHSSGFAPASATRERRGTTGRSPAGAPDERVERADRSGRVGKVVGLPDVHEAVVLAHDSPCQLSPPARDRLARAILDNVLEAVSLCDPRRDPDVFTVWISAGDVFRG